MCSALLTASPYPQIAIGLSLRPALQLLTTALGPN